MKKERPRDADPGAAPPISNAHSPRKERHQPISTTLENDNDGIHPLPPSPGWTVKHVWGGPQCQDGRCRHMCRTMVHVTDWDPSSSRTDDATHLQNHGLVSRYYLERKHP